MAPEVSLLQVLAWQVIGRREVLVFQVWESSFCVWGPAGAAGEILCVASTPTPAERVIRCWPRVGFEQDCQHERQSSGRKIYHRSRRERGLESCCRQHQLPNPSHERSGDPDSVAKTSVSGGETATIKAMLESAPKTSQARRLSMNEIKKRRNH